jgi:HNH endonuclease
MRCIFCKGDSTQSRSVEHIIPEALGNIEHVLPRGIVCDTCNNYFARKVEGPLLETQWFWHARSHQAIGNKRGFITPMSGIVPGARLGANVWLDTNASVTPRELLASSFSALRAFGLRYRFRGTVVIWPPMIGSHLAPASKGHPRKEASGLREALLDKPHG